MPHSGRTPLLMVVGLLLLTGLVYAPTLGLGFVWDDNALVIDYGDVLADPARLLASLTTDLWSAGDDHIVDSGYYRPLMLVSLAVDRLLFGLDAWGYHLHSVLWHLLSLVLLFSLLRKLLGDMPALMGAALFALHPVHAEAVIWIAARNDLIAAALVLFVLVLLQPLRVGWLQLAAATALTAAAVLGKESALLLPLMVLVLDRAQGYGLRWGPLLATGVGVGAALGLRAVSGVGAGELPLLATAIFFVQKLPSLVVLHLSLLALPWPLSGARSLEWMSVSVPVVLLGVGVLAGGATVTVRMKGAPRRFALAGVALALLGFAPALLPLATKGLVGERYLYLPMAGVSLWFAAAAASWPRPVRLAAVGAVLGGGTLINLRIPDWSDDLSLWTAAMQDTPNPYVFSGLGHTLNRDDGWGDRPRSAALFIAALEATPPMLDACGAVITATLHSGQPARAAAVAPWSLERGCPWDGDYTGRASVAQAFAGDWAAARATLAAGAPDPRKRDLVVRAALMRLDGDEEGYTALRATWPDGALLDAQVERLLRSHPDVPGPG